MNGIVEALADVVQRIGRRPAQVWMWRAVMLACGLGAQLWIMALRPYVVLSLLALCAIALAVIVPRTVVPLVAAALIIAEAAMSQVGVFEAVPVALLLLGWHTAATALTAARPWARVAPSAWRALTLPCVAGVAGIAVAVPLVWIAERLPLPPMGLATAGLVLLAALGMMLALWPASEQRR